jgi:hypothetical protein
MKTIDDRADTSSARAVSTMSGPKWVATGVYSGLAALLIWRTSLDAWTAPTLVALALGAGTVTVLIGVADVTLLQDLTRNRTARSSKREESAD